MTPGPTSSTTPTGSCPTIKPDLTGYSPRKICTSVPQMVVSVTRISASPTPGLGLATSRNLIEPCFSKTAARIMVIVRLLSNVSEATRVPPQKRDNCGVFAAGRARRARRVHAFCAKREARFLKVSGHEQIPSPPGSASRRLAGCADGAPGCPGAGRRGDPEGDRAQVGYGRVGRDGKGYGLRRAATHRCPAPGRVEVTGSAQRDPQPVRPRVPGESCRGNADRGRHVRARAPAHARLRRGRLSRRRFRVTAWHGRILLAHRVCRGPPLCPRLTPDRRVRGLASRGLAAH